MTSLRINTGPAIVGKIGSVQRTEFTSIGEPINLASRHEGATRDRAVDILVSGYSDVAAPSRFPFEPIGQISIEGKAYSARTHMIKTVSLTILSRKITSNRCGHHGGSNTSKPSIRPGLTF